MPARAGPTRPHLAARGPVRRHRRLTGRGGLPSAGVRGGSRLLLLGGGIRGCCCSPLPSKRPARWGGKGRRWRLWAGYLVAAGEIQLGQRRHMRNGGKHDGGDLGKNREQMGGGGGDRAARERCAGDWGYPVSFFHSVGTLVLIAGFDRLVS